MSNKNLRIIQLFNTFDNLQSKFNNISEAYNVLKDPVKRKTYDNYGEAGINGAEQGMPGESSGFDPFSMFRDFFQKENN